jgi:hypothetical protein
MAGTVWHDFAPSTKAKSSEVDENFDWMEGSIVPMSAGSTTDAVYDLGTTTARWRDLFISRTAYINTSLFVGGAAGQAATGTAQFRAGSNVDLIVKGNVGFTTTAVSINATNDSNSANIPLEIRASMVRITVGGLALQDTTTSITEFSTDGTMAGNSDSVVPTEKAIKTYVDDHVGLLVRGYVTVDQTATFAATVKVSFTDTYDKNGEFSATSFVASTNGTYEVITNLLITAATSTSGPASLSYNIAGSVVSNFYVWVIGTFGATSMHGSDVLSMTAGQTLTVLAASIGFGCVVEGGPFPDGGNLYIKRIA